MLFLISNFQYLTVAIAFSTAYPFRKQIYTNLPYFLSILFLFFSDTALVLMPNPGFAYSYDAQGNANGIVKGTNPIADFFFLMPFATWMTPTRTTMQSFYYYRYIIYLGVICNSIGTLAYENYFI